MKIIIDVSEENECTDSPWWVILDPTQNMKANPDVLASQVTGPYFSREKAQEHLDNRRYAFGKNAVVYCMSGYWSREYREAIRAAKSQREEVRGR